ncbi:hypothetical protein GDO86_003354 [Hymenochirus boettgeri]|uniref:Uncharacterized protein n=1 Tax=Hymenochirus boettgeri TaxID=247094 RepID=A0A8T2K105_9PIPI|nr:hypothetical protein GDO86_003354 [Hymenochirus boettgeri]
MSDQSESIEGESAGTLPKQGEALDQRDARDKSAEILHMEDKSQNQQNEMQDESQHQELCVNGHRITDEEDSAFTDDVKPSTDGLEEKPRTWRSAPPTPISERRGISSSLLSLHTEQFLDLLSTAQTRRLEEQRAEFPPQNSRPKRHFSLPVSRNLSLPSDERGLLMELHRRRGGSWTGRSLKKKPPPLKIPAQEELYNTIIGHQAK